MRCPVADTLQVIVQRAVRSALSEQKAAQQRLYESTAALDQERSALQEKLASITEQIDANQTELKAIDVLLDQLSAERDSLQAKAKE